MKKINYKLFLIFFILSFFTFDIAFSFIYFPMKVGNKYIFHYVDHSSNPGGATTDSSDYVCNIVKDSIINNKTYYLFDNYLDNGYYWLRVDSLTGSLYSRDSTNPCSYYFMENLRDSLLMPINGTANSCNNMTVNSIGNVTRWGIPGTDKNFFRYGIYYTTYNRKYNSFFGIVYTFSSYYYSGMGGNFTNYLKGCVLDGVVYGDTVLVNIKVISNSVPVGYSLAQNYPNPFNPSTNKKFNVPAVSSPHGLGGELVQLKVYDIIGREIQTLVNERLQPGTYEANFNAGNLPSGIYFYTLFANDSKIDTKKMIVLK